MIINGTDLSTVGFTPEPGRHITRLGGEQSDVFTIPGAIGGLRLAGSIPPGRIVQPGWVKGTDHDDLLAKLDDLSALLQGEVAIRFPDIPDKEWVGYLQSGLSRSDPLGPDKSTRREAVTLEFLLPDPTAWEQDVIYSFYNAITAETIDLGTAPSPVLVEIHFPADFLPQATITIGSYTMSWEAKLPLVVEDGDVLFVDAADFTVTLRKGGAFGPAFNAIDGISANSEFPIADPAESPVGVQVTFGGGTPTQAQAGVRKRWW